MVYFVLALALFQQDSYDDVAENLVGALGEMDQPVPDKSSFTRARQQPPLRRTPPGRDR
ncbi:transposase domain-containing protein [Streptomyces sp. NPDC044780]|uniref:transposase domain-containing protein n=1 Tax=unclassified Streptomyces TaxID=2593676 RepID=UPI0033F1FFFE